MYPDAVEQHFSLVQDPFAVDREKWPKFPPDAEIYACELQPGEALYIPSRFWTHHRALTTSITVEQQYQPSPNLVSHKRSFIPRRLQRDPEACLERHAHPAGIMPFPTIAGDPRRQQLMP